MTVITYRDGVMACDSCWSEDNLVIAMQPKIFRLRGGALYGAAGDVDDRAIMDAVEGARTPADLPSFQFLFDIKNDVQALVVFPNGDVYLIETDPAGVMPVRAPFSAIGCGKKIALGALAAGKSAVEAAEIACEYDVFCRPPIYLLNLDGS
jgi:ATP-dependent protease HslVU (ClpYQ) peptidase subunit